MEITQKIADLISNLLKEKEIELIDLAYRREGPNRVLRLIVDKKGPPDRQGRAGGITIDECAIVNQYLGELLDKENIFNESYVIEVSSPGLDRLLKTKKDFDREIGKIVRINTYGPVEDNREHIGTVVSCEEDSVTIQLKGAAVSRKIPLDKIAKARLEIEF